MESGVYMEGCATVRKSSETSPGDVWTILRRNMEAAVLDCAAVAGEQLWSVTSCPGTDSEFRICSAWDTHDYVELKLQEESRLIVCRFGPAVSKPELQFEIEGGFLSC